MKRYTRSSPHHRQQSNFPFLSGIRSTYKALQDWLRKQIVSFFLRPKKNGVCDSNNVLPVLLTTQEVARQKTLS